MQTTVETMNRQLYDMKKRYRSIGSWWWQYKWTWTEALERTTRQSDMWAYKDGQREGKWKNWLHKVKNTLGDIMQNDHWRFWMDIAEKNYKTTDQIADDGDIEDSQRLHTGTYNDIGKMLKTLFTEKIEEDSEGFLIIKRNEDGLKGYAEIFRHMMELTGEGMNDKMTSILKPP